MTRTMRRFLLLTLSLLALAGIAHGAALPDRFDPARDAAADVAQAVATANAEGKRVIVDVGGEWCSWCHILDRLVAGTADVSALVARNYVWVKVNFSKENRNEALLSRWPRIKGYPHLFVLDGNGELLHSQDTSVLEAGRGYDKARVVDFLKRWAPPHTATRA